MSDTIFVLIAWFIIRKKSYSTYIVINPFFITKISQWNGFARMADEYPSDLAAMNFIGVCVCLRLGFKILALRQNTISDKRHEATNINLFLSIQVMFLPG